MHTEHWVAPVVAAKLPAAQAVHAVAALAVAVKVPAAQVAHAEEDAYEPAGHVEAHADAPAEEKEPLEQGEHALAPPSENVMVVHVVHAERPVDGA